MRARKKERSIVVEGGSGERSEGNLDDGNGKASQGHEDDELCLLVVGEGLVVLPICASRVSA